MLPTSFYSQDWDKKTLDALKAETPFIYYVWKVAALLVAHKGWCSNNNVVFANETASLVMGLASEFKTESRERQNTASGTY